MSSTVADLTFGSQLEFEARGQHTLRGVERKWELFAASDPIALSHRVPGRTNTRRLS